MDKGRGVNLPDVTAESTFAFGLLLRLTTTEGGGRQSGLAGGASPEARFTYRPNWGLPHMTGDDQTGALVLGFSKEDIRPGDQVRVVIVPPFPAMLVEWSRVPVGAELRMYEGRRLCGRGTVLWKQDTQLPLPEQDEQRFRQWLLDPAAPKTLQ